MNLKDMKIGTTKTVASSTKVILKPLKFDAPVPHAPTILDMGKGEACMYRHESNEWIEINKGSEIEVYVLKGDAKSIKKLIEKEIKENE